MDLQGKEYQLTRENDFIGLLGYLPKKVRRNIAVQILRHSFGLSYDPMIKNYTLIALFEKVKKVKSISMPLQGQYAADSFLADTANLK